MRADMAKVIVERPRKKGCAWDKPKGYRRRLMGYGEDGPPAREGIKACWGRTKYLNEHLGPLRRYLDKQVGRPWDKIFSEICTHIDRNSAVQDHVRDHVEQYVLRHVFLSDGVPCIGRPGWGYGRPLHETGYGWYVCPRTGLLRRNQRSGRKRKPKVPEPPRFVRVDAETQCRLLGEAWHLVTLRRLPVPSAARPPLHECDVLLNRPVRHITSEEAVQYYGAAVYAVACRRLARRELGQYPIPYDWWDER